MRKKQEPIPLWERVIQALQILVGLWLTVWAIRGIDNFFNVILQVPQ